MRLRYAFKQIRRPLSVGALQRARATRLCAPRSITFHRSLAITFECLDIRNRNRLGAGSRAVTVIRTSARAAVTLTLLWSCDLKKESCFRKGSTARFQRKALCCSDADDSTQGVTPPAEMSVPGVYLRVPQTVQVDPARWQPPDGVILHNDTPQRLTVMVYRAGVHRNPVWGWIEAHRDGTWERPRLACGFMMGFDWLQPGEKRPVSFAEGFLPPLSPGLHRIAVDIMEEGRQLVEHRFAVSEVR